MEDYSQIISMVKVICLIIIAVSAWNIASQNTSYFSSGLATTGDTYGPNLRFATGLSDRFIGSGANEPPVFYNLGSVSQINDALQKASQDTSDNFKGGRREGFDSTARIDKLKDITTYEHFAGSGL